MADSSGPGRPPIEQLGEFGLIDRISKIVGPSRALAGIGDDAAVIDTGGPEALLVTVDMQVEHTHFRLDDWAPTDLGRRVIAVNISDIAAMGGSPRHILTSLALPSATATAWVEDLYRGMTAEAAQWDATIVGGNLARTHGPTCIDIILLGSAPPSQVVLRSGARPGDLLAVTGPLGAAASERLARERGLDLSDVASAQWIAGARSVQPRVREGLLLARNQLAHAMLDVSDGLAGDLEHLCRASKVDAEIRVDLLPIDPETHAVARALGRDPAELALTGGEDYELLIALSEKDFQRARSDAPEVSLHVIGRAIPPGTGLVLTDAAGHTRPLNVEAWRHF